MIRKLGPAAAAAVVVLGGAVAVAAFAAPAGAAVTASPQKAFDYSFASDTYDYGSGGAFRVTSWPQTHSDSTQSLDSDGNVDLTIAPGSSGYADSGVIVDLGTLNSLFTSSGTYTGPAITGSSNLGVNFYFATNGTDTFGTLNASHVLTGADGNNYASMGSPSGGLDSAQFGTFCSYNGTDTSFTQLGCNTLTMEQVQADYQAENGTEGVMTANPEVFAWVGISGSSAENGYVTSVGGKALVSEPAPPFWHHALRKWTENGQNTTEPSGLYTIHGTAYYYHSANNTWNLPGKKAKIDPPNGPATAGEGERRSRPGRLHSTRQAAGFGYVRPVPEDRSPAFVPTFVVVGEALIDLSAPADDGSCIARPGGSPMNVAVGLARLGQATAFAGRLSGDPFGAVLRRFLERSEVSLRHAASATERSTIALVQLAGGHASYQFALGADFHWSEAELAFLPASARAVHFGSLASWLPPGDAVVAAAIGRVRQAYPGVLISYDPNVRPALQPDAAVARQQVEASVRLASVIKASTDDLRWLYPGEPAGAVALRWLSLGARLVVVTAGADGATGWAAGGQRPVTRPPLAVDVIDTVGAGDAFTSGLLDALARRDLTAPDALAAVTDPVLLGAVLDDAAQVAGLTCARAGASPPTRAEVDASRPADRDRRW